MKKMCDLVKKTIWHLPPKGPSMASMLALGLGLGTPIHKGKPQNMNGHDLKNKNVRWIFVFKNWISGHYELPWIRPRKSQFDS